MAWSQLALALAGLGDHEGAAQALRRSLELDPGQATAWSSLAGALLQLGRLDEAERAAEAALARDPAQAPAWQVKALALGARNDFPGAAEAFGRAIALAGESATLCAGLGATLLKCGRFAEAAAALERAAGLDPTAEGLDDARRLAGLAVAAMAGELLNLPADDAQADLLAKAALLLLDTAGERAAAARVAEAWAARRPDSAEARHLRDAATSRPVDRQPAALVAERFDAMAEDFDAALVGRLGYDGPSRLAALLASQTWATGQMDILDLGCGTGLCGAVLRPLARRLVGVDLSGEMLAKARARGLYDALECADLVDAVSSERRWDLIAAMDAFPYLGDLEAVFAGAVAALRPGGGFVFSVERGEGPGFILQGNGRYAHGPDYIAALARERFELVAETGATLRREGGRHVPGGYYLLRLRG